MSPAEQRHAALKRANEARAAKAELRVRLASERGVLADVMRNPPELLAGMAIIDVIRLAHISHSTKTLQRLGRLACRDGVNLLVPLGQASERTREWVAVHASWNWQASPGWARTRRSLRVQESC